MSVSKQIKDQNSNNRSNLFRKQVFDFMFWSHPVRFRFDRETDFNDCYWAIKEFIWDNIDNE
jgi:hypothetical protein